MGEHGAPEPPSPAGRHQRRRPTPAPLPVVTEVPRGERVRRSRGYLLRRRARRQVRSSIRYLRSKRGAWVLIGLACIAVLIVGLASQGFLSPAAPSPSVSMPPAAAGLPSNGPSGAAATKATRPAQPSGTATGVVKNPVQALRSSFPDNPLNHLRAGGLHNVVISASSAEAITLVGFLVPTGLKEPYGTVQPHSRSWSEAQQASGSGYLAAVFVQTGRSGVPITCRVSVDGKVTNVETTSGSYGRAVCLG